jgi:hypothetical protein
MVGGNTMNIIRLIFTSFLCCISLIEAAPSHVVTFFFQKDPSLIKMNNEMMTVKNVFGNDFNTGIFVTYFGFKASSDHNGQISFPRKHQNPKFSVLVCNDIEPQFMTDNTIYTWNIKKGSKHSFYHVERIVDEKTKLTFWSVEKKDTPSDEHIPLNTIVVHASPDALRIPTGITITSKSEQLVLPTIYVKSNIKLSENALSFLQNNDFFSPVQTAFNS